MIIYINRSKNGKNGRLVARIVTQKEKRLVNAKSDVDKKMSSIISLSNEVD